MIPYLSEAPARGSLSMSPGSDGCAQVWSLTSFFQFAVCKKIIGLPGGQNGKTPFSSVLPTTPSTLGGLFEMTR